jgi:hypothetical protein
MSGDEGPPAHPVEPTCPCCLPALGGFSGVPPRGGSTAQCTCVASGGCRPSAGPDPDWTQLGRHARVSSPVASSLWADQRGHASLGFRRIDGARITSAAEDSPSGLGRTLGKRVGGNPSRVRIPHPPLLSPAHMSDRSGCRVSPAVGGRCLRDGHGPALQRPRLWFQITPPTRPATLAAQSATRTATAGRIRAARRAGAKVARTEASRVTPTRMTICVQAMG